MATASFNLPENGERFSTGIFMNEGLTEVRTPFLCDLAWRDLKFSAHLRCLEIDLSMKRLMHSQLSQLLHNVILPSFIALIEYQKETKPQVNLKETLSQVNNNLIKKSVDFFC